MAVFIVCIIYLDFNQTPSMKLNKLLTTLTFLTLFTTLYTQAQPQTGIKAGLNFSNLMEGDVNDENVRLGFHAGIYSQVKLRGPVFLMPELTFSTKGNSVIYDVLGAEGKTDFNLYYIDMPLLAGVRLGEVLELHLGPYMSYMLGANIKTEGDLGEDEDELNRKDLQTFDYGISGGLAFNFDDFGVGARYNWGRARVAKRDAAEFLLGDAKNSVGQIYLRYRLSK
ncbi:Outer membrane protein beta-barrel domain-containing protein [Reichenbachiella agariperforans]|uniref:Outer membrane protein beta-barrel domain-containing protein n=2 Tax=Reichenbachiella agariperforans TaxID=156994 RepID=A0A1M6PV90_REIAG|nr:Outer membrane protein beta-barrel domain-containing protein [Reichenbachiella agariperforans]